MNSYNEQLNKFKNTTIYGDFRNSDRLTSAIDTTIVKQANAIIDRDLLVSGTLTTSGLLIGTPSSNVSLLFYIANQISGITNWGSLQTFNVGLALVSGASITANSTTITDVQLSYLSTLSSNIQTQVNNLNFPNYANTWSHRQDFNDDIAINNTANLWLDTGSSIMVNSTAVSDVKLSYISSLSSNIQDQVDTLSNSNLTKSPTNSPTFTGTPLLTTSPTTGNISQQIADTNFVNNTMVALLASNNSWTKTNNFSNSLISPYLNTYNNLEPTLTIIIAANTVTNSPSFSKTVLTSTKVVTTTKLINTITIPANFNKTLTISIPVSVGLLTGSMTCTASSTLTMATTLSAYSIDIAKNGVLLWKSVIPNTSGVTSSTTTAILTTSGAITYDKFMAQFIGSFVPDLLDTTATYDVYFTVTNSMVVSYSGTLTALGGIPTTKINTSTFTSTSTIGTGAIGSVGTGGSALNLSFADNNNGGVIGNTYLNNLTIAAPPSFSYSVLPTLTSKQIGYSVPITYTTGTTLVSGTFKILAQTTGILPTGNFNVFWTTANTYSGTSGVISNGLYGVIFSATVPTSFSGSSYTQVHNQTATTGLNQLYTGSAYVSQSGTYSMYLCVLATFTTVIITTNALSNLQVIRSS